MVSLLSWFFFDGLASDDAGQDSKDDAADAANRAVMRKVGKINSGC